MQRVMIIGCPGSGKSTFARKLHALTHLPLYHLDLLYWNADKTPVAPAIFQQRLNDMVNQKSWIIDGNYHDTLQIRIEACDSICFLDYPTPLCLAGALARRGTARPDMPWIEPSDYIDEEFIQFIKDFPYRERPRILSALNEHPEKAVHRFVTREQSDMFLQSLT